MLKNKYGFLLLRTTLLALFFMFGFINNVFASVNGIEKVVFYAIPNSFVVGEISKVISIKAQDSSGNNQLFDDADGLLELSTDSPTGSFYSNTSATNPINTLSINNKTYSGRNFYYRDSSEGNFVITVKLSIVPDNGKSWTATQDITVTNSSGGGESNTAVLTGISVTNPPTKTIYGIGDSLNISGMVVAGTYDNGSTSTVPVVVSDISGFDSSTSTIDQILTILYKEKTATFSVSISSSTVADIPPTTIITKIVNHHSTHYLSEDLSDYVEEESFK
ncbi:MAG: bacterial Ig-like domain-containing protein, partial [Bacteroidaceae bacterium]